MSVRDVKYFRQICSSFRNIVSENESSLIPEILTKWEISKLYGMEFIHNLLSSDVSICSLESMLECFNDIDKNYSKFTSHTLCYKEPDWKNYNATVHVIVIFDEFIHNKLEGQIQKEGVLFVTKMQMVVYLYQLYIKEFPTAVIHCGWFIQHMYFWPCDMLKKLVRSMLCPYRYFQLFHDLVHGIDITKWFMKTKDKDILFYTLEVLNYLQIYFVGNKTAFTNLVILELVMVLHYVKYVNNAAVNNLKPRYLVMFVNAEHYFDRLQLCKIMLARTFAELLDV